MLRQCRWYAAGRRCCLAAGWPLACACKHADQRRATTAVHLKLRSGLLLMAAHRFHAT